MVAASCQRGASSLVGAAHGSSGRAEGDSRAAASAVLLLLAVIVLVAGNVAAVDLAGKQAVLVDTAELASAIDRATSGLGSLLGRLGLGRHFLLESGQLGRRHLLGLDNLASVVDDGDSAVAGNLLVALGNLLELSPEGLQVAAVKVVLQVASDHGGNSVHIASGDLVGREVGNVASLNLNRVVAVGRAGEAGREVGEGGEEDDDGLDGELHIGGWLGLLMKKVVVLLVRED
jgi:hypothetical protein